MLLGSNSEGTFVSDVSILRLNFQTGGKTYNLGVVSDKQTGEQPPVGEEPTPRFNFWQWLADLLGVPVWAAKLIFWAVVTVFVFGIICAIFPPFRKVLYVAFAIIFFPFTLIYYLIKFCEGSRKRRRARKQATAATSNNRSKRRRERRRAEKEAAKPKGAKPRGKK